MSDEQLTIHDVEQTYPIVNQQRDAADYLLGKVKDVGAAAFDMLSGPAKELQRKLLAKGQQQARTNGGRVARLAAITGVPPPGQPTGDAVPPPSQPSGGPAPPPVVPPTPPGWSGCGVSVSFTDAQKAAMLAFARQATFTPYLPVYTGRWDQICLLGRDARGGYLYVDNSCLLLRDAAFPPTADGDGNPLLHEAATRYCADGSTNGNGNNTTVPCNPCPLAWYVVAVGSYGPPPAFFQYEPLAAGSVIPPDRTVIGGFCGPYNPGVALGIYKDWAAAGFPQRPVSAYGTAWFAADQPADQGDCGQKQIGDCPPPVCPPPVCPPPICPECPKCDKCQKDITECGCSLSCPPPVINVTVNAGDGKCSQTVNVEQSQTQTQEQTQEQTQKQNQQQQQTNDLMRQLVLQLNQVINVNPTIDVNVVNNLLQTLNISLSQQQSQRQSQQQSQIIGNIGTDQVRLDWPCCPEPADIDQPGALLFGSFADQYRDRYLGFLGIPETASAASLSELLDARDRREQELQGTDYSWATEDDDLVLRRTA